MTFLQGLDGKQYAGPKGLYTAYIISAAKGAKNPVERAAYCSMLSSLDSVDFYTVSYTYTEQGQFNLDKSSSCVSATPTQNRVPQGVGVRFPPRAPAFAREAERRLPAVALAKAGDASRRELRLASQPYQRRRSNDGPEPMRYVYLLQSIKFPDQTYVGLTDDLRSRFSEHNRGRSPHTAKYRPWCLVSYVAFSDERKAVEFERYLKSASGRAFANKRLR